MRVRAMAAAAALMMVFMLLATTAGAAPAPGDGGRGDIADKVRVALEHLANHRGDYGLTRGDVTDALVTDAYRSEHSGVTHVYLRQRLRGVEVADANMTVNVSRDDDIVYAQSRFVPDVAAVSTGRGQLGPVRAVKAAAEQLGLRITEEVRVLQQGAEPVRRTVMTDGGISARPISARRVYHPTGDGRVVLAWTVEIEETSGEHWWDARVDADTGALLASIDYVDHDDLAAVAAAVAPAQVSTTPASEATASTASARVPVADGSSYRVYATPLESPNDGERTVQADPADAVASPYGWHDIDASTGPEHTVTRGNNVHAYTDHDANGTPDAGSSPDGGAALTFDHQINFTAHPHTYAPAAVTNLFYWNNVIHDVFYRYGFNEAAGNFQINNYGNGGAGNDDVRAEAQDGAGMNNANFSTPVDGDRPRMQMYLWQFGRPNNVIVDAPSSAAGQYEASRATFGPQLDFTGVAGAFARGQDALAPTGDGCEPLQGFPAGAIAVLDRSTCGYDVQVLNAQTAGASAAVIVNNVDGNPPTMNATTDLVVDIPSLMVTKAAGESLKSGLPATGRVAADVVRGVNRDGDLDSGIITHEYGHGISNRLTGGPSTGGCLSNQEQMGEGWSDWLAVALTARPGDDGMTPRGIGTYALYTPDRTAKGIRPTAYSQDVAVNPATYDTIKTAAVPHGVGYVWATMLWEVYWDLVAEHGFNPDVYGDWTTGGNNLAIQLVMDGMKMQPCSPGFVNGRDAILAADAELTGGQNQCRIWRGFAKRGLGKSAVQGSSSNRSDGTEAFDVPEGCQVTAAVAPSQVTTSVTEGSSTTADLVVTNGASSGGGALEWTVSEAATDCANPSDVTWLTASPASGSTGAGGSAPVTLGLDATGLTAPSRASAVLCVSSNATNAGVIAVPVTVTVQYPFNGFYGTLKKPGLNSAKAGSSVPVLFSLGGFRGLDLIADGSPSTQRVDCRTLAAIGDTIPTSGGPLTYDATSDRYNYGWQTTSSWKNTCRTLTVSLDDGSAHEVYFRFK